MILTTDFHTHILPGIDDGSHSVEESMHMICQEQQDQVKNIVFTPHFYPQKTNPERFLKERQQALDQLLDAFDESVVHTNFVLGAEVLYYPGMSQWEQLDKLTMGDTKYILIELPFGKLSDSVSAELQNIYTERGLTPILAHIERYLPAFGVNNFMKHIARIPVLLQSNCDFLIDQRTQRLALRLIREHRIHLFGSDCHSTLWRPPVMAAAREILLNSIDRQTLLCIEETGNLILSR